MQIFFNDFEENAKEIELKLYYKLFADDKVVIDRCFFLYTVDHYCIYLTSFNR